MHARSQDYYSCYCDMHHDTMVTLSSWPHQAAKELLRKYGQAGTTAFRAVHNEGNAARSARPPPAGGVAAAGYPAQYGGYGPPTAGYPPQGYPPGM